MPRRQPFTALCSQMAALGQPSRADLHVHTTASDGEYTPSQVVHLARQAGLAAVAITDHDTFTGIPEAQAAADGRIEVIPGVEITAEFDGREFHLLGYFARLDHQALNAALARVCASRRIRFEEYTAKLAIPSDRAKLIADSTPSLGRRHVARLVIACGMAATTDDAFRRHLAPLRGSVAPKLRIPLEEAIALLHAAGGMTSLAHPPLALDEEAIRRMQAMGLDALEAEYAWRRSAPAIRLRDIAARLGLLTTGGSDCHGPHPVHRHIGSVTVKQELVERLRSRRAGTRTPLSDQAATPQA
jgi:3',5'-nucleoside bisphosphate phosphatase